MPDERDRCISSGMDGCLAKPVKREVIEAVLRKIVAAETAV